jgi:hypothetical protein
VHVQISWSPDVNGHSSYSREENIHSIELPSDMRAFQAATGVARLDIALAHEAGHYFSSVKFGPSTTVETGAGGEQEIVINVGTKDSSEIMASNFENGYRNWIGVPQRASYGSLVLPRTLCLVCLSN